MGKIPNLFYRGISVNSLFSQIMRQIFSLSVILLFLNCQPKQESFAPVGQKTHQKSDLDISMERNKSLNEFERQEIEKWIAKSGEKFYKMPLNYWSNTENLAQRKPISETEKVSFSFYLYDFDEVLIYEKPISFQDIPIEKIPKLQAIRDVMRYLKIQEETILLVPSVLAYGTYGDDRKIEHDIPLMIKIKRL